MFKYCIVNLQYLYKGEIKNEGNTKKVKDALLLPFKIKYMEYREYQYTTKAVSIVMGKDKNQKRLK